MSYRRTTALLFALCLAACSATPSRQVAPGPSGPKPPVAARLAHEVPSPFGARQDEYYWLRDDSRQSNQVLSYLSAENDYARRWFADRRGDVLMLYREMVLRIKPDDYTVPWRKGDYWYYTRYDPGENHPVLARRFGDLDAREEILIDGPTRGRRHRYYQAGEGVVSVDGTKFAWTEDTRGRREYVLRFRDLNGREGYRETIEGIEPEIAIANDNRTVFYVQKDPQTLLGVRVRRHVMGTDPARDVTVYEERDRSYFLSVGKSRSERFVFINVASTLSSEQWYADAADPKLEFHVISPRERGHEYEAEDLGEDFVLRTNWQAPNFRLVQAPIGRTEDRGTWRDLVPERPDALVEEFLTFEGQVAYVERSQASRRIRLKRLADGVETLLPARDPSYAMYFGDNHDPEAGQLRYLYSSLVTPTMTCDLDFESHESKLLKQDAVLGGFDPKNYESALVYAESWDGALVPISLAWRKGTKRDGTAPVYLRGYGAYGLSEDPVFKASRVSLLDRGVVVALAHVRGGQELGRAWYEDGRQLHKKNTFDDFVAATRYLVQEGYAAPDGVVAVGGSAGGLLMGAVANQHPELYRAIIAHVPFVDAVTTMLDDTIPLTSNEYDEWGDPRQREHYEYLLSYSPYDNVKRQDYPAMLVTTSLWDSQVQYFEPAKWVARLRAHKTDRNPLLLTVDLSAGHGGKSGRLRNFEDSALEFGFIFGVLGRELKELPTVAEQPRVERWPNLKRGNRVDPLPQRGASQ
jgi:oligopeptidase B